jgi:hypothetical protein
MLDTNDDPILYTSLDLHLPVNETPTKP